MIKAAKTKLMKKKRAIRKKMVNRAKALFFYETLGRETRYIFAHIDIRQWML